MARPVHTVTPSGEPIVILSADEYRRLLARLPARSEPTLIEAVPLTERASPADPAAAAASPALSEADTEALRAATTPLAFWRKKRGLSQKALADRIGATQPYLNHLEAGKRRGTVQTFQKLAAALEIDIKDLLGEGAKSA